MSKYYSYMFYADRNVRPCTILGYSHNIPQKSQDTRVIETSGTIAKEIPNQTKPTSTDLRAVAPCIIGGEYPDNRFSTQQGNN